MPTHAPEGVTRSAQTVGPDGARSSPSSSGATVPRRTPSVSSEFAERSLSRVTDGTGSRDTRAWRSASVQVRRARLGVVFGGGGALGAFEVGVIDALASQSIVPDLLIGTSVGAINAAYWGFHPTAEGGCRLLDLWLRAGRTVMLPEGRQPVLLRRVRGHDYVVRQRLLARPLKQGFNAPARIEDSRVPLIVVTVDPLKRELVRLTTGPLVPALLASAAVPGLFPPARVGGRWLIDGGLLANCDIEAAMEAGMSDVIAVDLMGQPAPGPLTLQTVLERALGLALRRQTDLLLARVQPRLRLVVLRPRLIQPPGFTDLDRTRELFEAGRAAGGHLVASSLGADRHVRPGVISFTARNPAAREDGVARG